MRVLVMGGGSIGGYYGALLVRAGHRVTFVARGPHLDAMQRHGLRVERVDELPFVIPAHALSAPEAGTTMDLVLFTVKAYDSEEAVQHIRPAMGPDTVVLSLQNGVDSGDVLAAALGRERVLEGVAYIEAAVKSPGVVAQLGGTQRVLFGESSGEETPRARQLRDQLREAGWNVERSPHIARELWSKLAFIGPFAAVSTITGLPMGPLRERPECLELMKEAVGEVVAVGNAEGAGLPPDAEERALAAMRTFPAQGLSSMQRDRLAGQRLEVAALVGTVVRRGDRRQVATPITRSLYALLAPMLAPPLAP